GSCPPANPGCPPARHPTTVPAASDDLAQLEDRQVHRHHNTADQGAEEYDDDGLHQAGQPGYHFIHFSFVEISRFAQHVVNGARFFTNGTHLYHHRREYIGVAHGGSQAGAGGHFLLDLVG